jgi:hypothetical protein
LLDVRLRRAYRHRRARVQPNDVKNIAVLQMHRLL